MTPAPRAGGDQQARMPVVVVTTDELERYVRRMVQDPASDSSGYSELYDYKKTDIALNPAGAVTAARQILGGDVQALGGWSLRETTGAAVATLRLRDGSTVNNEVLAVIGIAAAGTSFFAPYGRGIEVSTGKIFLDWIAGSVEGVIYWR